MERSSQNFDRDRNAWVLTRYSDVLSALREPRLWPVDAGQLQLRAAIQAALAPSKLAAWQSRLEPLARRTLEQLPEDRPVDLIAEFAHPWSLASAVLVTGAGPAQSSRLGELAQPISAAAAEPEDPALQSLASAASTELERHLAQSPMPIPAPTFVALSQTVPRFLAGGWLALLQHPAELARLEASPDLMPRAIDELLRYAGLARTLSRHASEDLDLAGLHIAKGEKVILDIAAANRDPGQFPAPDRLDFNRPSSGQLALGAGPHSCVGAPLIRLAASIATTGLIRRSPILHTTPIEWYGGSAFRSPANLPAMLQS